MRTQIFALASVLTVLFTNDLLTTDKDATKRATNPESEDIVSEVVLRAPWAEKNLVYDGEESPPGEFGLHSIVFPDSLRGKLPDPPLPEGPNAFTVAPNGDLYITDPLNKRIQRFDANGNFISVIPNIEGSRYEWSLICADRIGDVYLLWWGYNYTDQALRKYNQEGNLLTTYPLFPEVRFGGSCRLYCDDSGRLFFEYSRKESGKIIVSLKEELSLKRPYAGYTFQIGTWDLVFTPQQQEATLREGVREVSNWTEMKKLRDLKASGEGLELSNIWNRDFVDEKGDFYLYYPTTEGISITKWHKQ
jgi:hypothetical protein